MDESVLRRRVLVGCAKNECPHTERIPCAHLKTMLAALDLPLRLTPR